MTKNNFKVVLFASLIVAMVLPFSGMNFADAAPNENANDKAKEKGKLIIKDKKDMKNISKEDFAELKKNFVKKSDKQESKQRGNIDKVVSELDDLQKTKGIWITSIGTDYETGNIQVSVEKSTASDANIKYI